MMKYKRSLGIVCLLVFLAGGSALSAETGEQPEIRNIVDSIEIQSQHRIRIHQPVALKERLARDTASVLLPLSEERHDMKMGTLVVHRAGYRIQVYSDNKQRQAKFNAERLAGEISALYPLLGTYLTYKAPYWRLRVGDFQSRDEALSMLAELKENFPGISAEMTIVRDRINIIE